MLASSGGFVAICPKKEVELGADKLIHRADHAEELRQEIEFPCSKAVSNQYAHLCGGALRAINPNSSMTMAETETCAAVFKGNLFNKAELAMQLVGCPPQLNEAQLLLHLYAAVGLDMLGRLQGQYAFCLYDSKQARVLAARDHSGAVPLVEGRTAAGSLIIACGTFLPEGVHQMVDIQPGEYKYGWHALPRQFKCGATKIVSGRASCDYGIRRRSIDAFNASPQTGSRQRSLDIPSRSHGHGHGGSSSGSHTPGRYIPPHTSGGYYSRQRATSLDSGHWGPAPAFSSSLPSPQNSHFGGRRKSENNNHGSPDKHPQQQQHHAAKVAAPAQSASANAAAAAVANALAPAAAAKAAAAALAAAAATTAAPAAPNAGKAGGLQVSVPAAAAATPTSPGSEDQEACTPLSAAGTDGSGTHRRKRRHRSRKHKGSSPAAAAAGAEAAGASSDTESQVSTSTHDSANSAPTPVKAPAASPAAAAKATAGQGAAQAGQHKAAGPARRKSEAGAGSKASPHSKPAGTPAAAHGSDKGHARPNHHHGGHKQHQQQQWQPKVKPAAGEQQQQRRSSTGGGSGFQRTGSCGELAALGSSPTPVLQVPPQGLAC